MLEGVDVVEEEGVEEEVVVEVVELETVEEEGVEEEVVVEVVETAALGIAKYAAAPATTIITITMTATTVRDMARDDLQFKLLMRKV